MVQSLINNLPMVVLLSMIVLFFIILGTLLSNNKAPSASHKTMPNGISFVTEEATEEED